MRAMAVVRLGDGEHELGHGDLIGRTSGAALLIDDPRVSEAHAMVSLRRSELYLLALRRLLQVDGKPVSEVRLRRDLVVGLADELALTVARVQMPEAVVGLRLADLGVRVLPQVASVLEGSPPRLVGRLVPGAAAHIWSTGDRWRLRRGRERDREIRPGDAFTLGGVTFTLTLVPIDQAGLVSTLAGATASPLRIVAFYDTVQIHRRNREVVTIGGSGARILSELVACAGPASWEVLAGELWPGDGHLPGLRHRWDVALGRLRGRLREAGVRDLLRADGSGQLTLELYDGDEVDDQT
jgi:hypothetical protein